MEKGFRITRRSLDALRPQDGSVQGVAFTDDELSGFHVVVYASGEKSFKVRFRVNGQRRTVKIGSFPAMTPEVARKEAMRVLSDAARGVDEAATRQAAREAAEGKAQRITFGAWRGTYLLDVARRRLKSSSEIERYLVLTGEAWDKKPMADISVRDVQSFRDRIADSGKTTTANRWFTTIAASFATAVRAGHLEKNPFKNVRKLKENDPRQRVLSEDEEARLREALATWPNVYERTAFAIMIDTGARLGEVLAARWEDFVLDANGAGLWQLPKTKSGRAQVVPILSSVGKLILATPKLTDCEFLIPGRNGLVRRHDLRNPWRALKTAAKIPADADLRGHDLRRSYGLRVARGGAGMLGASKLLRHSSVIVTERIYAPFTATDLIGFAKSTETARVKAAAKASKVLPFQKKKTA